MIMRSLICATLTVAANAFAEETPLTVEWLAWPVVGVPYHDLDDGILLPRASTRFNSKAQTDVIIGLRSDGVVVWKYLEEPRNKDLTAIPTGEKATEKH